MNTAEQIIEAAQQYLVGPHMNAVTVEHIATKLLSHYEEPWRKYHTINHIGSMATLGLQHVDELKNPRRAFWSTLGHDALYIPRLYSPAMPSGFNEELSAQFTEHLLMPYLPRKEVWQIGGDIRATADHRLHGGNLDRAHMLDWDMSILGAEPDEFDDYDNQIQQEFSFVDRLVFCGVRLNFFNKALATRRIYLTNSIYEKLEQPARNNLARKRDEYLDILGV